MSSKVLAVLVHWLSRSLSFRESPRRENWSDPWLGLRWKESEATQNYPPTTAVAAVKVGQGEAIQGLVI